MNDDLLAIAEQLSDIAMSDDLAAQGPAINALSLWLQALGRGIELDREGGLT